MQKIIISSFSFLLLSFFLFKTFTNIEKVNVNDKAILNNISFNANIPADTTVVEIKTEGIELSYSVPEIKAKAGDILRIQYINESDMNHNIVLVKREEDIRPVGVAALQAIANDWIPEKEMDRIIAYSALAHAGDTVSFSFKVPPPGIYPYICTYSAHWTQMQGRLISAE
ncbi:Copper binding protein, plastocyanin/azurin family [Cyclobacterium lianum]|uniref:Copper binding protein, plastocyanin/azurin family n=1 Tax=Cyclobacterium lianum TaxID=388280 RepID=A0A1M7QJW7_9BACT|nr:plastocyanin/azurin family copper-binding protein [Cyclobacterium lianum]SHN31333.1 Copper binding protein, plastocyanin/azurin family [Cyclobacterium lianum]